MNPIPIVQVPALVLSGEEGVGLHVSPLTFVLTLLKIGDGSAPLLSLMSMLTMGLPAAMGISHSCVPTRPKATWPKLAVVSFTSQFLKTGLVAACSAPGVSGAFRPVETEV